MPHSLARIYLHLVFSTRLRAPFLFDIDLRKRLHRRLAGICRRRDSAALEVGGVEDHVHVLCTLGRTTSVSELVKELKRESSLWLKAEDPSLGDFAWQEGYGAFSVSPSHVATLVKYIRDQERHHRKETFDEEYQRLVRKYGDLPDRRPG